MPELINTPTLITAAGSPPKKIEEYVGRVNTRDTKVSVARMQSPAGWSEPGQTPLFDEFTLVLKGLVRVEHRDGCIEIRAGQTLIVRAGEWVRYSTPEPEGAEYISVCVPAFSPAAAQRDGA